MQDVGRKQHMYETIWRKPAGPASGERRFALHVGSQLFAHGDNNGRTAPSAMLPSIFVHGPVCLLPLAAMASALSAVRKQAEALSAPLDLWLAGSADAAGSSGFARSARVEMRCTSS